MTLFFQSLRDIDFVTNITDIKGADFGLMWDASGRLIGADLNQFRAYYTHEVNARIDEIESHGIRSYWPQARTIALTGALSGSVAMDGSEDVTLQTAFNPESIALEAVVGLAQTLSQLQSDVSGKLDQTATALRAERLAHARTVTLTGPVTGSFSFDGSEHVSFATSIGSNALAIEMVDGLQPTLDQKLDRGDFGLGGPAIEITNIADPELSTQFVAVPGTSSEAPVAGVDAAGLHVQTGVDDPLYQILIAQNGRAFIRAFQGEVPATRQWNEIIHTGWFNPEDKMDAALSESLIFDRGTIGASTDLNTVVSTGYYHQPLASHAASGENYPIAEPGRLMVLSTGTGPSAYVYQNYHEATLNRFYYRVRRPGTGWSVWKDPSHAASIQAGVFPVIRGGTGRDSLPAGEYLKGNGTGPVQTLSVEQVREEILTDTLKRWDQHDPDDVIKIADPADGDIVQYRDGEWISTNAPTKLYIDGGNY